MHALAGGAQTYSCLPIWALSNTYKIKFGCLFRHRLVVPKYNPARTFSPEGAVGLGGAYMCIYPMESPGGYQLIGRTLPIWNTFGRTAPFSPDTPWLLRYFDQVRGSFLAVSLLVDVGNLK